MTVMRPTEAMKKHPRLKSDYSIQTVSNALRLLEAFSEDDELGVSELSRRLGLHKNNVFRLLATLEERGYIEQSASSDRYWLGVRCLELGRSYARGRTLLSSARAVLEDLTEQTGESSHLGVLRGFEVVHLDGESPRHLVATVSRVGMRLPAHCTALGKVLLGCSADSVREEFDGNVVRSPGLEKRTEKTIVDRDKFFEHLRGVGVQGFGVDLEECEAGLCCVAAPIFDHEGQVLAALSVSGPAYRVSEDRLLGEFRSQLVDAANRISATLGHPG
jgi:DNA-binding IclR family transcriptional regulator